MPDIAGPTDGSGGARDDRVRAALAEATRRYEARHARSAQLHAEARQYLPGGNTRTVLHDPPFPIAIRRGEGHLLFDEDGHEYVMLYSFRSTRPLGLYC